MHRPGERPTQIAHQARNQARNQATTLRTNRRTSARHTSCNLTLLAKTRGVVVYALAMRGRAARYSDGPRTGSNKDAAASGTR